MNGPQIAYAASKVSLSLADMVKAASERYAALDHTSEEANHIAWAVQTSVEAHAKFMQYACAAASGMIVKGVCPF